MHSEKRLHTSCGKRLQNLMLNRIFYLGAFALLVFNVKAFAVFNVPPGAGSWSCALLATSLHYPSGPGGETVGSVVGENPNGPFIYDDYYSNYGGGTSNGKWNCDRRFFFTEYTNLTLNFSFEYGNEYATASSFPVTSHIIKIYLNQTNMHISTSAPYDDKNSDGSDHIYTFTTTTPGEYRIEYWRNDGGATTQPDIIGRFVLIPQATSLSIDVTPICTNFMGTQYNFQVHSVPYDFSNIIQAANGYQYLLAESV